MQEPTRSYKITCHVHPLWREDFRGRIRAHGWMEHPDGEHVIIWPVIASSMREAFKRVRTITGIQYQPIACNPGA